MKIMNFGCYTDGGTIEVVTDDGAFYLDHRLDTTTYGKIYKGYPEYRDSNIIKDDRELKRSIILAFEEYKNEFHHPLIDHYIKAFETIPDKGD